MDRSSRELFARTIRVLARQQRKRLGITRQTVELIAVGISHGNVDRPAAAHRAKLQHPTNALAFVTFSAGLP